MVGDKNIYVVYDPKIEDSSSLSKFLGIVLDKAHFPIKLVEFITLENYVKLLEKEGPRNFTICLNKTYSDVSLKYGAILEEATFKFFSRYYQNPDRSIAILGLLMDVDTIFSDDASKKNAWGKLVTFQKFYAQHQSTLETLVINIEEKSTIEATPSPEEEYLVLTDVAEVMDDDIPEVIKSSEDIIKEEKIVEPIKKSATKKSLSIKDAIVPKSEEPSYETLLEFYKLASLILGDISKLKALAASISK